MAINDLTADGEQKTWDKIFCSVDFTKGIRSQLLSLLAANINLSITAFLENVLILCALHKGTSLHPRSKLLYRNLAVTDLCVGIIAEPIMVGYMMSAVNEQWALCRNILGAGFTTSCVVGSASLLTITSISVDRLLALLLKLQYRQVVTLRRAYAVVAAIYGSFPLSLQHYNFGVTTSFYGFCTIFPLRLAISTFSYARISIALRSKQIHDDVRYRRAISSSVCVYLALVICFLPSGVVRASSTKRERSSSFAVAQLATTTFAFFNSSLNPILYCWKIVELRQAVKGTIRHLCYRLIGCFV